MKYDLITLVPSLYLVANCQTFAKSDHSMIHRQVLVSAHIIRVNMKYYNRCVGIHVLFVINKRAAQNE